jgi:predicted AAA+ superfamily ATPase
MEDEKTRKRELKSLREAMGETGVKEGTIVTHEDEDEIREGGYTIRVVPAWRYLLEQESL